MWARRQNDAITSYLISGANIAKNKERSTTRSQYFGDMSSQLSANSQQLCNFHDEVVAARRAREGARFKPLTDKHLILVTKHPQFVNAKARLIKRITTILNDLLLRSLNILCFGVEVAPDTTQDKSVPSTNVNATLLDASPELVGIDLKLKDTSLNEVDSSS